MLIGAVWLACILFLVALAVLLLGGLVGLILFVVAAFIGSLIWETYKYFREIHRLKKVEKLNLLDNEPL